MNSKMIAEGPGISKNGRLISNLYTGEAIQWQQLCVIISIMKKEYWENRDQAFTPQNKIHHEN